VPPARNLSLYGLLILTLLATAPTALFARELTVTQVTRNTKNQSVDFTHIESLKNGYLLMSTDTGVRLFDGYQFIPVLNETEQPNSPLNTQIYATLEDLSGTLWFASTLGLYRLDPGATALLKVAHDPSDSNTIVNDNVREIMQDSTGHIWFGTLGGVSRLNPLTNEFVHFPHSVTADGLEIKLGRIKVILQESPDTIWVGSSSGLYSIDLATGQWRRATGVSPMVYVTSGIVTAQNELWFGTDNHGIFKLNIKTREFAWHTMDSNSPLKLRSNRVWALYQDKSGKIWIGYWQRGVSVFDLNEQKGYEIYYRRNDDRTLPGSFIQSITSDRSGLIWIATNDGAAFYNAQSAGINSIHHIPGRENGLADSYIYSIAEDPSGNVWLGTETGLGYWDLKTNEVKYISLRPDERSNSAAAVVWQVVSVDPQHLLLSTDFGLTLFNTSSLESKQFNNLNTRDGQPLATPFYSIEQDKDGWFYVASNLATVHRLNPLTGENQLVIDATHHPETKDIEYFLTLLPTSNDTLWLGSTTGLFRLNLVTGKLNRYLAGSDNNTLSGNAIYDLHQDNQGSIWVATSNGGINKISLDADGSERISTITKKEGLPSNEIYNLVGADGEKIWFSSRNNIGQLDVINNEVKVFSFFNRNKRNYIEGASFKGKQGQICLAGSEVLCFIPELIEQSQFQPMVRFSGVSRSNQPVSSFLPLVDNQLVELYPEDTQVTFHFASLDFAHSFGNQYQYRLTGYDKHWMSPGTENKATYTHLSPGRYRLTIKGTNRDELWSPNTASIDIVVYPPFWRSEYAYWLYAFILLGFTAFVYSERHKKRQRELLTLETIRQSEARLRDVLWGSGDVLWRWDLQTNKIYSTDNVHIEKSDKEAVTEFEAMIERIHPDDQELVRDMIERHLRGQEDYYEAQFRMLDPQINAWKWHLSRGRIVERDPKGHPQVIAGTRKNIDELKKTEKQLRYLANYDQLTRLPNRSLFHEHLNHAIEIAKRFDEKIALLFFDLDGFKLINDSLGHAVGDQLLQAVALRLTKILRTTDSCARLGGDEFAVIIERIASPEEVTPTLERILNELSQPFDLDNRSVVTSVSIGVAIYPQDGIQPASLLKHADIAMYEAKREGKKNFCFYKPEMNALLVKRLVVENDLKLAITDNQFETYYQPRVSVKDNRETGFEALIRWRHPSRGLISPAEFIPIAEETGQILELGNWILGDACRQGSSWYAEGWRGFVSVNIAALQFQQSDLVQSVEQALFQSKLPADSLELEITEGTLIKDIDRTRNTILRLKKIGVRIALDDFGTGYSSLSYLQQLPIDALKIDRSFISLIPHSSKSARLCKAIINMAHSLDLQVVAEGIEEPAQLAFLKEAGCEEYQGYYYGKPLPASQIKIS
jgi:diguanylate cyclase (GGDEF)-like protein